MNKVEYVSDEVFHDTRDYTVKVGAIAEDKLPVYVVTRKKSGVVEFAHEVEAIVLEWIEHFETKNAQQPIQGGTPGVDTAWAEIVDGDNKAN